MTTPPLEINTKWLGKAQFQAVAEALGISTDQIVLAYQDPNAEHELTVAYSVWDGEGAEPSDHSYYIARISRDADDILVMVGEPIYSPMFTEFMSKVWDDIPAEIERRLEEEHGSASGD